MPHEHALHLFGQTTVACPSLVITSSIKPCGRESRLRLLELALQAISFAQSCPGRNRSVPPGSANGRAAGVQSLAGLDEARPARTKLPLRLALAFAEPNRILWRASTGVWRQYRRCTMPLIAVRRKVRSSKGNVSRSPKSSIADADRWQIESTSMASARSM